MRAQHTIAELQQQLEQSQQTAQQVRLRLTTEVEAAKAEHTTKQELVLQLQRDKTQLQEQLQQVIRKADLAPHHVDDTVSLRNPQYSLGD